MNWPEFMGGSKDGRATSASAARCRNLYIEPSSETPSGFVMLGAPGYSTFVDLTDYAPDTPGYAISVETFQSEFDRLFLTIGEHLLEIDRDGSIIHDFEPVTPTGQPFGQLVYNGTQIFLDGGNAIYFVYDLTLGWTGIPVPDACGGLGGAILRSIDSYVVAAIPGNDAAQIFITEGSDANVWNLLDFASINRVAGSIVGVERVGDVLWFYKTSSAEGWQNTGNADFPFEPVQDALLQVGVVQGSVSMVGGVPYFLARVRGGSVEVHRHEGNTSVRVSSHEVEHKWSQLEILSSAHSIGRSREGHGFYHITTYALDDSSNTTIGTSDVLDTKTGRWFEDPMYNARDKEWIARELRVHVTCWGRDFVFSEGFEVDGLRFTQVALFELDLDLYTDTMLSFTAPGLAPLDILRAERICPYINEQNREIEFPGLALIGDTGVGTSDSPQSEWMLSWSKDRGNTYSPEVRRRFGVSGEFELLARWFDLGISRNRTFRLATESPNRRALAACILEDPQVLSS